jgi:polynucleotide 5'-kinase involved in rRNA processing
MLASPMLYGWYKQHWPSLCARSGKRVFVYGMQSSGASTFLYLLAQLAKSVGIIDL